MATSPFAVLPAQVDLPRQEREIAAWWREHDVFRRSLEQTKGGPAWVFYEGPPTANGSPGTHHVEARVFKDVFPRYRTMKGYSVPRQAGWDCHGLPVELAVERELGISGKPDIEKIGVAEFNARCRESVLRHVDEFEELTERMGYWVDMSHPYRTMSPAYIDSVWWSLRRIFEAGLLVEDFRVAPYCPRCGTTLSDHELAQGYETVSDPSAHVTMPLRDPVAGVAGASLLVWTTTPWTLVSNTAVAVNPGLTYAVARTAAGTFVVAQPLLDTVLGADVEVLATVDGEQLLGLRYVPPFDIVEILGAHRVVLADFVSAADGTGLVHLAPAFGADDLRVCQAYGLPMVNPIGADGRFLESVPLVGGRFFKDADAVLLRELDSGGRLLRETAIEHAYPHCWRCHTPLLYYAQPSWYIRTTSVRSALQRENERTNWYPEHIKHGRFGDWLAGNVDWALSRTRYWGTPLPLWRCADGHVTAIGSRAELGEHTGSDLTGLDPHRPYIDEIGFPCPECDRPATRVPEVIDAWYDSGAMPFAALGYPYAPGSAEAFAATYPAQYICEAIDQTRGWFYTMMAVGTLVFGRSSYENVVCLGLIVAEDGRKMSKHLGNVIAPIPLMDAHGADALRWFMACSGSPWSPRRVGGSALTEITRKLLMTYWNTASFFTVYAAGKPWEPSAARPVARRPFLDRWVLGELQELIRGVDAHLETYDTTAAGRLLAGFVDDLSNWYVRRSRNRFWAGDTDALATLFTCLRTVTLLLAPFVPFITEAVWQKVIRPGQPAEPESVHLAAWPRPEPGLVDHALGTAVATGRALAEAGRAARAAARLRIRQPLRRGLAGVPAGIPLGGTWAEVLADVADELNLKELTLLEPGQDAVVDVAVKANFRSLGKRFGRQTPAVAAAITAADPHELVAAIRSGAPAMVAFAGGEVSVLAEDVLISEVPRTGWAAQSHRGVTIALDTEITPALAAEGLARDVVRVVQQARREAGLAVTDQIALRIAAPDAVRAAAERFRADIARETLATSLELVGEIAGGFAGEAGDGLAVAVAVTAG